ncbi:peptidoglycan-binding protein [Streptomyces sp. NPDC049590]|uniref:peptidoglycan-binding protein n=1 Tax=Streptomyces sp. NPDC049590 TaxID=3154834 RepID=UPI00343E98E2
MATPLTASTLLAALKTEGLDVLEHPGWRSHNRNHKGAWGPVHGVMIHHTGGTAPSDGQIVWSGRADLPGPCAHGYLAKDGTLTLTSAGRANHAGGGDGAVLQTVIAESYGVRPPAPHEHDGSPGAVDGNRHFYGLEVSDSGSGKPWPAVQYEAAVRWAAAICWAHGWSAKSVIGHKEWSDWKPDPAAFDMAVFRRDVQARLDAGTKPKPPAPPTTPKYEPFPGRSFFQVGRRSPIIAAMHRRLVAEGCGRYQSDALGDVWGSGDERSYAAWQRKLGYAGSDADGIPGPTSWAKLHVPNV